MKEPSTEENYEEEYGISVQSELSKLNPKYSQLLNTKKKILTTDQSPSRALTTNQE